MLTKIHYPDNTQSVRYAAIPLQVMFGHTIQENKELLHCKMPTSLVLFWRCYGPKRDIPPHDRVPQ